MSLAGRFTKAQARRIRELGVIAHERELSSALAELELEFGKWRSCQADAFDLEQAIHKFHQGPARKLFTRYDGTMLDLAVAVALRNGVLSEQDVGPELLDVLKGLLPPNEF